LRPPERDEKGTDRLFHAFIRSLLGEAVPRSRMLLALGNLGIRSALRQVISPQQMFEHSQDVTLGTHREAGSRPRSQL
jgi:hypothetical protein